MTDQMLAREGRELYPRGWDESNLWRLMEDGTVYWPLGKQMARATEMVIPYDDPGLHPEHGLRPAIWQLIIDRVGWRIDWCEGQRGWHYRRLAHAPS